MSASSSTNDLRNRIIFTILILAVYRFGTFVPLPGIDPEQLKIMMEGNQKGLLGMFNVFAGGAVSRMAIFALGIMPYISSAIIAGGPVRAVCEVLGVKDIVAKSMGTSNAHNVIRATMKALMKQSSPKQISAIRNKKISEIVEKRG